jgi:hypothetical protein
MNCKGCGSSVTYFKVLFQDLPGRTEKEHENLDPLKCRAGVPTTHHGIWLEIINLTVENNTSEHSQSLKPFFSKCLHDHTVLNLEGIQR